MIAIDVPSSSMVPISIYIYLSNSVPLSSTLCTLMHQSVGLYCTPLSNWWLVEINCILEFSVCFIMFHQIVMGHMWSLCFHSFGIFFAFDDDAHEGILVTSSKYYWTKVMGVLMHISSLCST